jgi:hypothetical protein
MLVEHTIGTTLITESVSHLINVANWRGDVVTRCVATRHVAWSLGIPDIAREELRRVEDGALGSGGMVLGRNINQACVVRYVSIVGM